MQLKRCFFRIDKDARWGDVRDAIASHRTSEGGDGIVTLVLERPVEDDSAPLAREPATAKIAALQDIVLEDLKRGPAKGLEEELKKRDLGQRVGGLFDTGDDS